MTKQVSGGPLLDNVHRVIADKACAVLSLDIFDTVLWRRVPRPTDVFGLLASRMRDAGLCPPWVTDATLRRLRIAAEDAARRGRDALGTEVSLFDIWRAMPDGVFGAAPLEQLVEAELLLERELTVVDLDVAEVVKAARKQDIQVVLVSDTYFTDDQLARLLDRPELGPMEGVRIFRSNQHGTAKASGLWEIVLRDLGRSPEQIVHIGDHEVADHEVPGRLGIRTVHYRRLDDDYLDVLEREKEPVRPFGDHAPDLDDRHGDFGLTSLRAKAVHSGVPFTTSALDVAWRYGAGVLGPVLTGFAEWAAWKAHESGTRRLWCSMREGELLSRLINEAAAARGWDVRAAPVWLSRFVTSLAGLDPHDTAAVHAFVRTGYRLTVRQALSVLELQPGDVPGLATELDTVIDNGDIADRVASALTETPHLCNRLAVTVTAARERMIRSLRDAGALDDGELTLVDLGWGGTIQRQLARALEIARIDVRPAGLYLATDTRSERVSMAGLRAEGYLAQAGHPAHVAATITRSPEIVEQCVNALCGSLIGYTEEGAPVLGQTADSPTQNAERRTVQDGILAFQHMWNRYVTASGGAWPDLARPPAARDRLARILVAALESPTPEEAAVFGNWTHEDNFGSSLVTTLLPADLKPAIPYLSPGDLGDLDMRDSFWPALIAASDTGLGAMARAIADGAIAPEAFDPAGRGSRRGCATGRPTTAGTSPSAGASGSTTTGCRSPGCRSSTTTRSTSRSPSPAAPRSCGSTGSGQGHRRRAPPRAGAALGQAGGLRRPPLRRLPLPRRQPDGVRHLLRRGVAPARPPRRRPGGVVGADHHRVRDAPAVDDRHGAADARRPEGRAVRAGRAAHRTGPRGVPDRGRQGHRRRCRTSGQEEAR